MTTSNQLQKTILPNTIALVLCGGNSTRMGKDKSMLQYYDKPQSYHVYDMLLPFCEKVFISCNTKQADNIDDDYNTLVDVEDYSNTGPMSALLTAFTKFSQKNILLVGCDYPFLSFTELINFAACCTDVAVSFYNEEETLYEPALTWYAPESFATIKEMYANKDFSLQHFLQEGQTVKYYPADRRSIISVDTPEDFIRAQKLITGVY